MIHVVVFALAMIGALCLVTGATVFLDFLSIDRGYLKQGVEAGKIIAVHLFKIHGWQLTVGIRRTCKAFQPNSDAVEHSADKKQSTPS